MYNLLFLILSYLIVIFLPLQAQLDLSTIPSATIHGVNLITGEVEDLLSNFEYEYEDKKVKKIIDKKALNFYTIEFEYHSTSTSVISDREVKDVYHFDNRKLLIELEHQTGASQQWTLYRKERLFWNDSTPYPTLSKRVVEDSQGTAHICYLCDVDSKGQLIKETLVGNLSGICELPLIIQENGNPLENGIESYSVYYEYDLSDPPLLIKKTEDNGMTIEYYYEPTSKKCTAKLIGNHSQLISRCFYEYDQYGFISKTIVDDGQGLTKEDLSGATHRKIMHMQSSHEMTTYGQPLIIENKFYDFASSQEVLLDKIVCSYSSDGQLIQQDFYNAEGQLKNSTVQAENSEDHSDFSQENYQINNRVLTSTDKYGNEVEHFYDEFGRLIKTVLPLVLNQKDEAYHPTLKQQFNVLDQIVQVEDQAGNQTTYAYTIRNKPSRIEYADGSFESYVYGLDGELHEQVDKNGIKTVFSHDALGRVSSKQLISPEGCTLKELFYSYQGNLQKTLTDQKSFTISYHYDGAGRKIGYDYETKEGKIQKIYAYDAIGQLLDPDEENFSEPPKKVEKTSPHLNEHETILLNDRNQFVKVTESCTPEGCKQTTIYDALGRPEKQTIHNSLGIKIAECKSRHDTNGQKVLEKHYKIYQGEVTGFYIIKWKYDLSGRLIEVSEGASTSYRKKTNYQYNSIGQLQKLTQPNGVSLNYIYNQNCLLDQLISSDQSVHYQYEYDELYRLVRIHDKIWNSTQSLLYDGFNQLLETKNDDYAIQQAYDSLGQCTKVTLPDQTAIRYIYDQNILKTIERLDKNQSVLYSHQYEYGKNNQLVASHLIKNIGSIFYQVDQKNQITSIDSPWWSQSVQKEKDNGSGSILSMQIKDPKGTYEQFFAYTEDGQLLSKNTQINTYDSLYNPVKNNWQVNEINQLVQSSDFQFVYDKSGNLIKKYNERETHTYVYDALNRLIRYENAQKHAVDYRYDSFNRRIAENNYCWDFQYAAWISVDSYHYLYEGLNEIGKMDSQGQIIELRVLDQRGKAEIGAAVAIELKGRLFVPIHDIQGSVRCLIAVNNQTVAEFYRYSTFGEEKIYTNQNLPVEQSTLCNPWRYFSKRYDTSTQLIFFGLRYYDPSIQRWTTPDPCFFCDTPNLYAFVKNDPLNHYDLQGLFSISTLWNSGKSALINFYNCLKAVNTKIRERTRAELQFPGPLCDAFEKVGHKWLGECTRLLLGYTSSASHRGAYGRKQLDKVRVTFINGILTTDLMLQENLDLISQSHGGIKVHYIFRGTNGWTSDIGKAVISRTCYILGYRSAYAYRLAQTWRTLIEEMGGVEGGGIIIHYAHSLGGCDTDRARDLLTPAEQKMIRVFTFGSATLVRNQGFQNVVNIISANDGVSSILLEPLGRLRNYFDPKTNVRVYGTFSPWLYLSDHLLRGATYQKIVEQLGQNFIQEFMNN